MVCTLEGTASTASQCPQLTICLPLHSSKVQSASLPMSLTADDMSACNVAGGGGGQNGAVQNGMGGGMLGGGMGGDSMQVQTWHRLFQHDARV